MAGWQHLSGAISGRYRCAGLLWHSRCAGLIPPACCCSHPHCPAPQVKAAYALLDGFHHGGVEGQPSVTALMEEAEALRRQQDLFELYVSDYVFLQRSLVRSAGGWLRLVVAEQRWNRGGCPGAMHGCLQQRTRERSLPLPHPAAPQEELGHLKALWDATAAVLHTFQAWSGTLWGAINVEGLMEECKSITKARGLSAGWADSGAGGGCQPTGFTEGGALKLLSMSLAPPLSAALRSRTTGHQGATQGG